MTRHDYERNHGDQRREPTGYRRAEGRQDDDTMRQQQRERWEAREEQAFGGYPDYRHDRDYDRDGYAAPRGQNRQYGRERSNPYAYNQGPDASERRNDPASRQYGETRAPDYTTGREAAHFYGSGGHEYPQEERGDDWGRRSEPYAPERYSRDPMRRQYFQQDQNRWTYGDESGDYSGAGRQQAHSRGAHQQDEFEPDYQDWRRQQVDALDDDYRSYRKERRKKFSDDFEDYRKNRRDAKDTGGSKNATTSASPKTGG